MIFSFSSFLPLLFSPPVPAPSPHILLWLLFHPLSPHPRSFSLLASPFLYHSNVPSSFCWNDAHLAIVKRISGNKNVSWLFRQISSLVCHRLKQAALAHEGLCCRECLCTQTTFTPWFISVEVRNPAFKLHSTTVRQCFVFFMSSLCFQSNKTKGKLTVQKRWTYLWQTRTCLKFSDNITFVTFKAFIAPYKSPLQCEGLSLDVVNQGLCLIPVLFRGAARKAQKQRENG